MSSFTAPLVVQVLDNKDFLIYEPFSYYTGETADSYTIHIPKGFVTDFATTPRFIWSLFPPIGRYAKASVIHDYMYDYAILTKRQADKIFYDGMKVLKVPGWKRFMLFHAVRLFGVGQF